LIRTHRLRLYHLPLSHTQRTIHILSATDEEGEKMTAARMEIINDPTPTPIAPAPSENRELPNSMTTVDNAAAAQPAGDNVTDMTGRLTRKMIDQAKGLLMSRQGMTEPEAHRWIQKTAMDRRTPKLAIATTIVESLGEKSSSAG
jgi:hypothetical protein